MSTNAQVGVTFVGYDKTMAAFRSFNRNLSTMKQGLDSGLRGIKQFRGTFVTLIAAIGGRAAWDAIGANIERNTTAKAKNFQRDWTYAWNQFGMTASEIIATSAAGLDTATDKALKFLGVIQEGANYVNSVAKGDLITPEPGATYAKGLPNNQTNIFRTGATTQSTNTLGKTDSLFYNEPTKTPKGPREFDFNRDIIKDLDAQIRLLGVQKEAFGQSATAAEALIMKQQALNEAIKAGHPLTAEEIAALDAKIAAYKELQTEIDELNERQKVMQDLHDTFQDSFTGFGQAIAQGTSFVKALNDQLANLKTRLLDMALNKVFDILFGNPASGQQGLVQSFLFQPRAKGGDVDAGKGYLVGENGPEFFSPSRNGSIIPNGALGGGGMSVNIINNAPADVTPRMSSDGKTLELMIDRRQERNMADPNSNTSRIVTARGARNQLKRR